jgi:hypothetical protein
LSQVTRSQPCSALTAANSSLALRWVVATTRGRPELKCLKENKFCDEREGYSKRITAGGSEKVLRLRQLI